DGTKSAVPLSRSVRHPVTRHRRRHLAEAEDLDTVRQHRNGAEKYEKTNGVGIARTWQHRQAKWNQSQEPPIKVTSHIGAVAFRDATDQPVHRWEVSPAVQNTRTPKSLTKGNFAS